MSDAGFDSFLERRAAERAAAPPKVTWRVVSGLTGGGWSGLGPNGQLVFVRESEKSGGARVYTYGRVVGKTRPAVGVAASLSEAKRRAAALVKKVS